MGPLADSHCHLGHIEKPRSEVLAEAQAAGVTLVVDIGMGIAGAREAVAGADPGAGVYAAVGIHPNDLSDLESDAARTLTELGDLAIAPGVVAVGETGLDYYRDRWTPDAQKHAFRAHIALAKTVDRTLVIHCRDAHDDVLRVLDDEGAPSRVVMHCFSGDIAHARECIERGFYCSFAGNVTYKKNDELRAAAAIVPDELLLVETDAPFLAPVPFRGKDNVPAYVVHTAATIADVKERPIEGMHEILHANTLRAFVIA